MQVKDSEAAEAVRESRAAIEAIEPGIEQRELVFNWTAPDGRPIERAYIQAELGMFPVQEFTTRITEIIESFTEGEMGMKLGELFRGDVKMPTEFTPEAVDGVVEENIQLIRALIKLVNILPGFQLDIMCLSLGVPRREHDWAKEQMQEPPSRGGLTVEDGFDILKWFIRQNAELLRETLLGKARELADEFRLHVLQEDPKENEEKSTTEPDQPASPGGTQSSTSSPATPENV